MLQNKSILSISPFIAHPLIHGSVTRTYHLNRFLSRQNRLSFVYRGGTRGDMPDFGEQAIPNRSALWQQIISPQLISKLTKLGQSQQFDLILANHLWSGLHGALLSRRLGVPLIFDNHNVEYVRFQKTESKLWPAIWLLERWVCRQAARVLAVSESDREKLQAYLRQDQKPIEIIENGVDIAALHALSPDIEGTRAELGIGENELFLLFFGSFTYKPNQSAVATLCTEIVPRLAQRGISGKLILIGAGTPNLIQDKSNHAIQILHLGFVDDLYRYVKSADVVVVPLSAGSGTRFKILESIACCRPVVSTTIGAEGIAAEDCQPFLQICDDWDNFVEATIQAANNKATNLPSAFAERYDWQRIVDRIEL